MTPEHLTNSILAYGSAISVLLMILRGIQVQIRDMLRDRHDNDQKRE